MAAFEQNQKCFFFSLLAHAGLLLFFMLSYEFSSTLPVFENTNKNDVISAVVLGDTSKSKMLPQKEPTPPPMPLPPQEKPVPEVVKEPPVVKQTAAVSKPEPVKKEAIALKVVKKKPTLDFSKDLLSDIKKTAVKQKQVKQKQLKAHFQKTLQEQAEKSLRQQLLNEDIKLQGTQTRQSQGVVDKYKALILQTISEHWVIPTLIKKHVSCELMIKLAPGGIVLDVQVTKSSGDPALDSSARAAVLKSSPLPVPPSAAEFESFRQFVLRVKPENIA
ncbi:MAG TPA: cell envelope integrity protein TolA [Gammaproteobacteria bacterium]|jgi:colicin import membrane protein|nr:cell envelope integrity protein TolA [Gammaproteobacteria bacterium]